MHLTSPRIHFNATHQKSVLMVVMNGSRDIIYKMDSPHQPQLTLDNFNMLSVIGKGSYAKVVLVKKKG